MIRQHYTAATSGLKLTQGLRYLYDHVGRKLKTWSVLQNNGQVADTRTLISKLDYNELGQLWKKGLHITDTTGTGNARQTVTYGYNERGWMSSSLSDQFNMYLYYNDATSGKQYNGNIVNQVWQAAGGTATTYTYSYDQLNRLTKGLSTAGNNESNITYDLRGNILTLNRYATSAVTLIDRLTYNYPAYSNVLGSVTDDSGNALGQKNGTATYGYDLNGNLNSDDSRGIPATNPIQYNLLNLPQSIAPLNTTYTYDATGQKLRKVITGTGASTTEYINGIQYNGTAVDFIQTEEGRALPNGAINYNYEYSLTDHLGNNRVSFDTGTGSTARQVQTDDYYPFGMESNGTVLGTKNLYLYNKKELQVNLNLYDYGARFYDPVIARWTTIDPLAELGRRWSPYNYVMNNPIRRIDPDGMWATIAGGVTTSDPAEIASFFRHIGVNNIDDDKKKDQHQGDHPVPDEYKQKGLPGFPGSKRLKKKKNARETWDLGGTVPLPELKKPEKDRKKIPKGWTGEWDRQHGEVEVYDKQGKHQGAWDPQSGEENEGKQRDDRKPTYNRFSSEEPDAQTMPIASPPVGGGAGFVQKIQIATGLTGTALWLYIIFSEGSRIYPPRNLVPIP